MSDVYLGIYRCPRHGFWSIHIEEKEGGGTRLTDNKCCGSWKLLQRWKVNARRIIEEIENTAEDAEIKSKDAALKGAERNE